MATADADIPALPATLHVGGVLERTIRVWTRHVGPCVGVTAVLYSPLVHHVWARAAEGVGDPRAVQERHAQTTLFVAWALPVTMLFASAFVAQAVVRSLRGGRAAFLGSFLLAVRRLPALVWVAVLFAGMALLWSLPGVFVAGIVAQATSHDLRDPDPSPWLVLVTFLALVPPALALVRMAVVMPVATIEGRGGMSAVWRSHRLTKGHRWRVFAVFLVLFLLHMAVQVGLRLVLPTGRATDWVLFAHTILVSAGLLSVASAVLYEDLRVATDGSDPEALGRVFE
jgi:hypothetical protein